MKIPSEWTFNAHDIARNFDSHVREQLPWYQMVTDAIGQIGRHFIPDGGLVYDIGASTGNIGKALHHTITARDARFVAIDASPAMAEIYDGPGTFELAKAQDYPFTPFDFAVSNLVMSFMAPESARRLLLRLNRLINPGGAIVVVERMLPTDPYLGLITSRLTIAAKLSAGVKASEVLRKELSLSGVQRPLSQNVFTELGAHEWFRFGDFAGWLIQGRQ